MNAAVDVTNISKTLLWSVRFKYLCEISDLLTDEEYEIAVKRIDEMYEMHEQWRPE